MKKFLLYSTILLGFCGCDEWGNPSKEYAPAPDISTKFDLVNQDITNARADGQSEIEIIFRQTDTTVKVKDGSIITFSSNKGAFLTNDILVTGYLTRARLRLDRTPGAYMVKAQVKDNGTAKVEKTISFQIEKALPDAIQLQVNRSYYNDNLVSPITIKTFLSRRVGKVSPGATVRFRAFHPDKWHTDVGRFENVGGNASNDAEQLADVLLHTDTPNILGPTGQAPLPLVIRAETVNRQGGIDTALVTLQYRQ